MEKNIIHEMIKDLESEFCLHYGTEIITEWKAFYNNWYHKNLNRYQYELEIYICNNLKKYLLTSYDYLALTEEEKMNIFTQLNNTRFRKGLFIGEGTILPRKIGDYKYIQKCLDSNDFVTIGHILSNVENAKEIYECIQSDWRYKTIKTRNLMVMINQLKNTKNKDVLDLLFDQLCLQDGEFGYSMIEILEKSINELDEKKTISIIKNIYVGGDSIRILDKEYKRSSLVIELIRTKKIEKVANPFIVEVLQIISYDEDRMIVSGIINNLSESEKEDIKFYLPKTNIKKV